jgi:hypothetical protein
LVASPGNGNFLVGHETDDRSKSSEASCVVHDATASVGSWGVRRRRGRKKGGVERREGEGREKGGRREGEGRKIKLPEIHPAP